MLYANRPLRMHLAESRGTGADKPIVSRKPDSQTARLRRDDRTGGEFCRVRSEYLPTTGGLLPRRDAHQTQDAAVGRAP